VASSWNPAADRPIPARPSVRCPRAEALHGPGVALNAPVRMPPLPLLMMLRRRALTANGALQRTTRHLPDRPHPAYGVAPAKRTGRKPLVGRNGHSPGPVVGADSPVHSLRVLGESAASPPRGGWVPEIQLSRFASGAWFQGGAVRRGRSTARLANAAVSTQLTMSYPTMGVHPAAPVPSRRSPGIWPHRPQATDAAYVSAGGGRYPGSDDTAAFSIDSRRRVEVGHRPVSPRTVTHAGSRLATRVQKAHPLPAGSHLPYVLRCGASSFHATLPHRPRGSSEAPVTNHSDVRFRAAANAAGLGAVASIRKGPTRSAVTGAAREAPVVMAGERPAGGRAAPAMRTLQPRRTSAVPTGKTATPERDVRGSHAEQRWRIAIARTPLEAPRAFPDRLLPMVRTLTGATTATYTTGSATRLALRAAGARGATTRTTIHLPTTPDRADLGLLAHELSHARTALPRPRFSLRTHDSTADTEERAAQRTANTVLRAPTGGRIATLPVGKAAGGTAAVMDAAVQAAKEAAHDLIHRSGLTGKPTNAAATEAPTTTVFGSSAEAPSSTPADGAARKAETALTRPATTTHLPTVDDLVRAVEQRVLSQLERRGGRYSAAF
jgi:hypothetical protein